MVKGLDVFQEHFAAHSSQFILIGGTAATLTMEQAGLDFRATKDLDIVLHIVFVKPATRASPCSIGFRNRRMRAIPSCWNFFVGHRTASCLPTAVA